MITSIKNTVYSTFDKLPISYSLKKDLISFSRRINNFIKENKGAVFFTGVVLFAVFTSPASALASVATTPLMATGLITACAIQSLSTLFGKPGFLQEGMDDKLSFLLGTMNLASWMIAPSLGLASCCYTIGVRACPLFYRRFFDIKT